MPLRTNHTTNLPIGTHFTDLDNLSVDKLGDNSPERPLCSTFDGADLVLMTSKPVIAAIEPPDDPTKGLSFNISNSSLSAFDITIEGMDIKPGECGSFRWDGTTFLPDATSPRTYHKDVPGEIVATPDKPVPIGADVILIEDSEDSDEKKKVSISNLPAASITTDLGSFNANDGIYTGSNPATANSRNGHPIISFEDTVAKSVVFEFSIPANYSGGDISIDIDWVAESATTGGVTWGIEIERNAPGGNDIDSDSFAVQQTGTSTTNGTSGVITRTTITLTQAEADAIEALDSYRMRLQRVVGDVGDDMSDDAQIIRVVGR